MIGDPEIYLGAKLNKMPFENGGMGMGEHHIKVCQGIGIKRGKVFGLVG